MLRLRRSAFSKGECDFFLNSDNHGNNSLLRYDDGEKYGAEYTKISVETDTLDNFYHGKDKPEWPNIILIDTEGHEQQVFDGGKKLFEDGFRPLIVAEFYPALLELRGKVSYHRDLVEKYGYSLYLITSYVNHPVAAINCDYLYKV